MTYIAPVLGLLAGAAGIAFLIHHRRSLLASLQRTSFPARSLG